MKNAPTGTAGFREALERNGADLVRVLRARDGIGIEKSADQMDEIQYATQGDLAIRDVDRDCTLLRQVQSGAVLDSRRQFRNVHRVRRANQPETPRGRVLGHLA